MILRINKIARRVAALCLILSLVLFADGSWIFLKAQLAQHLIAHAWQQSIQLGESVKPWPWADTWPVAKMELPAHDISLYVLSGAMGNALAFGPGHVLASSAVGERGSVVIAGHRDTHFEFMQQLQTGDTIVLTNDQGVSFSYRVNDLQVVNSDKQQLVMAVDQDSLILVTCYPFNAINPRGPLRYVASAEAVVKSHTSR